VLTAHGVEIERTRSTQYGSVRHTGRPFDLAIVGDGALRVRAADGSVSATRDGNFSRAPDGPLRDGLSRVLLGVRGPLHVPDGATIDEHGRVMLAGRSIDRIPMPSGTSVRSGFLESANVDAIGEMVTVLSAQRAFESAEKVVSAIDGTRQKTANEVARLK